MARPLDEAEKVIVETWLTPALGEVFFSQSPADQRHGYEAGMAVLAGQRNEPEVITAALMHDIGKRHARLGVVGRSVASVLITFGLPLSDRMRAYRDHGVIGAGELGALNAPSLAIDFALHHHRERPATIDQQTWDVLVAADEPQRLRLRRGAG